MATPTPVASDAANPEPDEPPQTEADAPAAESEGASDPGAVAAAATVEGAAAGDAPSAPATAPTSTSNAAPPPPPASPASSATPEPPRPQFAGSLTYVTPRAPATAPAFSYNVLLTTPPPPQVGSGAAHHQLASSPALMAPPIPAAALQPPAPRQYFGNMPSFSYNVVSHANATLPTGQQFQLDTGTNHVVQGSRFVTPASLQPPAPGQLPHPSAAFPGALPPNPPAYIRLPFSVPPRPSNIPFVASPQQAQPQAYHSPLSTGNLGLSASKSDAPSAPEASPRTMQLPTGLSSSAPSTIASTSESPSIPIQMPTNPPLPPRPEVFGAVGASVPGPPSTILSTPPSLLERPTVPFASPLPQTSPSVAAPGSIPQTAQQQFYLPYPSAPGIVPPQPCWGYPPQPTGFQQAGFQSYPPGPLGRPIVGTSTVSTSLPNVQPPGVSTGGDPNPPSTNPGSEFPTHTSAEPPSTGHGGQVNDQLEDKRTTGVQDSDAWSAHKTEAGVVYYYNAFTGELTYQSPPGYKGELEKVATQPVPVSWDKLAGTDWSIVTTSDGKKYYYDNKQKVSSWQLPPEVAELIKNAGNLKGSSTSLQDAGTVGNMGETRVDISTPAIQKGGRDSLPLRQTVAPATSSALDLIKKKLQDAGASSVPSPIATPSSTACELIGSKPADAAPKGQQVSNNNEKSKGNNGDGKISDSSSDSDDEEHGPSKEDCACQFKEMLKERGVAPFSKWEKELPKIVFDPRFKAIPSHSTRGAIFDHYVRTRADEERKEKRAAQKAAVEVYKQLLEEASEDINPKTDYQQFKRKWSTDPRFESLDRKEREALFNEKVKAIEEKVQSMRNAVITDFKSMLRGCKDITSTSCWTKLMDLSGPRWKKGKDGKDFAALAAANPMSSIVAELQASLGASKLVATLSGHGGDAILGVKPEQAVVLNRAAFGRAMENAGAEKQWFQLGPEEVFYLSHGLKCFTVESENKKQMTERRLWDHLSFTLELFPEMYKAYSHLRSKNWVVRSGLQYGADFVAYRHHPALVHSEFAVVVVPEGKEFGSRCGRLKVWSDLLCALRASGSVAKTLLVLTISSNGGNCCELSSPDCLEEFIVHERTITRWMPQQCRGQRCEPWREDANTEEQDHKSETVVLNYWGVILGFTILSSLLVYKLKF